MMTEQARRVLEAHGTCPHITRGRSWPEYDEWVSETGKCQHCNDTGHGYAFGPEVRTTDRLEVVLGAVAKLGWKVSFLPDGDEFGPIEICNPLKPLGKSCIAWNIPNLPKDEALFVALEQALIAEGWQVGETT